MSEQPTMQSREEGAFDYAQMGWRLEIEINHMAINHGLMMEPTVDTLNTKAQVGFPGLQYSLYMVTH